MQTKMGSGKYLTREYQEKYLQAQVDQSALTDQDMTWLGLDRSDLPYVSEHDDRVFEVDTQPVDPFTPSHRMDIRDVPGRR